MKGIKRTGGRVKGVKRTGGRGKGVKRYHSHDRPGLGPLSRASVGTTKSRLRSQFQRKRLGD